MKKRMEELEIEINEKENTIELIQDWHTGDDPQRIIINADQADILIKWLQEAKEIIKNKLSTS